MQLPIMYISTIISIIVVVIMLIKKMDIKISLFFMGIVLMSIALLMGNEIAIKDFTSTGIVFLDPLKAAAEQFKGSFKTFGFIILILGGYSSYMTHIKANNETVTLLTKPISKIKSVYILVPIVFLIGNFLSLVVPSASNLAIILLATLYPIMRRAGMSTLTAAGIIATTATVMPTPLGSDNVAIAAELANTSQFSGLTPSDYVFKYHALISIPTILFMAIVHYFWQKYCDKKIDLSTDNLSLNTDDIEGIEASKFCKIIYAILPLLPIILLIVVFILQSFIETKMVLSVEVTVIFSFIIAIICELFRSKDIKKTLAETEMFFKGMGNAMSIVALSVAGTTFVAGLQSIGVIQELQNSMVNIHGTGLGFVLPLILVAITGVIVILSGNGTSLFFAMVPLMVPLAETAGINVLAISVPMGLAGNLFRAVSPVSAVVMIVSGSIKKEPLELVKRTAIPMITGVIFMFILSTIIFL